MKGERQSRQEHRLLFVPVGEARRQPFGIDPKIRAYRVAAMHGLDPGSRASLDEAGSRALLIADIGFAFDPGWLEALKDAPGSILMHDGRPVMAHVANSAQRGEAMRLFEGDLDTPSILQPIDEHGGHDATPNRRGRPFVDPIDGEGSLRAVERRIYTAASVRVDDAVSLYLLRKPGFPLTRLSARIGLTANRITAIGALFAIIAFACFWNGLFAAGFIAAVIYALLDSIDGKLAKITGTSSLWGRRLDRWLDLAHPPFWYVGWLRGLETGTPAFEPVFATLLSVIIIGAYVLMRLTQWQFLHLYGIKPAHWRRSDSLFRLVSARRNINLVLFGASLVIMRPDLGIQWVAFWILVTLAVNLARLAGANNLRLRGRAVTSWLTRE